MYLRLHHSPSPLPPAFRPASPPCAALPPAVAAAAAAALALPADCRPSKASSLLVARCRLGCGSASADGGATAQEEELDEDDDCCWSWTASSMTPSWNCVSPPEKDALRRHSLPLPAAVPTIGDRGGDRGGDSGASVLVGAALGLLPLPGLLAEGLRPREKALWKAGRGDEAEPEEEKEGDVTRSRSLPVRRGGDGGWPVPGTP